MSSSTLNPREKRLLHVALLILFAYIIPFELAPWINDQHQDILLENSRTEQKIEQLLRLQKREPVWQQRLNEATLTQRSIGKALLQGANPQLVGADLQGIVRRIAESSKLNIQSMELPDFSSTNGWIFATQSIRFMATPQSLLLFLKQIEQDSHRLMTVAISMNTSRKQLSGSLSITGFSKSAP